MKRIGILLCLCFMFLHPLSLKADDASIYEQGSDDRINTKHTYEVFGQGIEGEVFATKQGVYIVGEEEYAISLPGSVLNYLVIEDQDQDGIKDMVVFMDRADYFDNLALVSIGGKEILKSTSIRIEDYNRDIGTIYKNQTILSLNQGQNQFFAIVDHSILCFNYQLDRLYEVEDRDNIWHIGSIKDINQDQIDDYIYTNQRGSIVSFNGKNGNILYETQLTNQIPVESRYSSDTFIATLNTWSIEVIKDSIYVTSEEGYLYEVERESGKLMHLVNLELYQDVSLVSLLGNNTGWLTNNLEYIPTGLWSVYFDDIKLEKIDDQRLLVYAFFGSDQVNQSLNDYTIDSFEKNLKPVVLVYDMNKKEITTRINIESYDLKSSNVIVDRYKDEECIFVLEKLTQNGVGLSVYRLETGQLVESKEISLPSNDKNDVRMYLSKRDDGYLIGRKNGYCINFDKQLDHQGFLASFLTSSLFYKDDTKRILTYHQGDYIKEIRCFDINDQLLWTITLPEFLKDKNYKVLDYEDTLIYGLIDDIDEKATYLCSYDLNTGKQILMKKVVLNQRYVNGKYVVNYLQANSIKVIKDINRDGKKDYLIDSYYVSHQGKLLGYASFNGPEGNPILVGDINEDGIDDYALAGKKEIRLYRSSLSYYSSQIHVSYIKTNKVYTYLDSLKNQDYALSVKDLNQDGISEIVINDYNADNKQIYRVLNGKDLSSLYTFMDYGVYDWNESFLFLDEDFNQDGYLEIFFTSPFGEFVLLNGKDGRPLSYFNNKQAELPASYVDEIIGFKLTKEELLGMSYPVAIEDINQDGNKDIAYLTMKDLMNEYGNYIGYSLCLVFMDGQTFNEIDSILITGNDDLWQAKMHLTFLDDHKIIACSNDTSWLYDLDKNELIASFEQTIKDGLIISETHVLVIGKDDRLSLLDISGTLNVDFTRAVNQTLKFTLDKGNHEGVVTLTVDGTTVAYILGNEGQIDLKEGIHHLTFELNDGQGKSIYVNGDVEVTNQTWMSYVVYILTIILLVMVAHLTFKDRIKKVGKKNGK